MSEDAMQEMLQDVRGLVLDIRQEWLGEVSQLRGEVRQLQNGLQQLTDTVSNIEQDQASMKREMKLGFEVVTAKLAVVEAQTAANTEQMTILQGEFKNFRIELDGIHAKLNNIRIELDGIHTKQDGMDAKLDTVIEQTARNAELEPRVEALEGFANRLKQAASQ